jgi:hypothetical protein
MSIEDSNFPWIIFNLQITEPIALFMENNRSIFEKTPYQEKLASRLGDINHAK